MIREAENGNRLYIGSPETQKACRGISGGASAVLFEW